MEPPSSINSTPPTIVVIFGASGDLTARRLAPAIFNLSMDSLLPSHCYLIGYGRKEISDIEFKNYIKESTEKHSRRKISEQTWKSLEENVSFQAGSYDNLEDFHFLSAQIDSIEKKLDQAIQCLFYISTPPTVFKPILENLGKSGLAKRHRNKQVESKVII